MNTFQKFVFWGPLTIVSCVLVIDILESRIVGDAILHVAVFFVLSAGLLLKKYRGDEPATEMPMAPWFTILLIAWFLTVVPAAVLGYGFSVGRFAFPDTRAFGLEKTITFIATSAWVLSPLLFATWGLRRRTGQGPQA